MARVGVAAVHGRADEDVVVAVAVEVEAGEGEAEVGADLAAAERVQ